MDTADDAPRLPLEHAETDAAAASILARVETEMGRVPNLYRMLAIAPELLEAWIGFAWPLRHEANTDRSLRELVIMRTAQLHRSAYEWQQHWVMATEAGVPAAKLLALDAWNTSDGFTAAERAVLAMTDELAEHAEITDPTWDALRGQFEEGACLELVLTAGFYACVSRVLNGLRVPLEKSVEAVPDL